MFNLLASYDKLMFFPFCRYISSIKRLKPNDWAESEFKACPTDRCGCDVRATPPNHLLSFGQDKEGRDYFNTGVCMFH